MMALAGAASTGVGALGHLFGKKDRKAAEKYMQKMLEEYGFAPTSFEYASPEEVGPSAYDQIAVDPRYKESQLGALGGLDQIQADGGLTLEDKAAQAEVMNDVARQEAAGRAQIKNDMAARGTLGSGNELAMRLANQQNAADASAKAGMNTLASAQKRYFDSLLAEGDMAGKMRGQEFGEKSKAAEAADAIAQYNAQARERALNQRNANAATQWDQRKSLADARARVRGMQAGQKNANAAATQQLWSGVASGVNTTAGGYAKYKNNKPKNPDEEEQQG